MSTIDNEELSKAYMVNSIKQEVTVQVMGGQIDLPLKDLADGCIGVSLWFDTIEHAKEWGADGDIISSATYTPRQLTSKDKQK